MQLYKSRGFSDFFQDTFTFLKQNGKHFFKHFFIINGVFILILMVFGYFFTKLYSEFLFGALSNSANIIEDYLNDNGVLFILLGFLFLVIALISATISYSYTPIYLQLYTKHQNTDFSTQDIINIYKQKIVNIFLFLLMSIVVGFLLLIPTGILIFLLVITIVGILLLPLVIGAFALFFGCTLMEYLEGKKGLSESYGYAWKLMSSKFWASVGSVGLFYFMSYIIQNVVSLIPYLFGMVSFFTTIEQQGQAEAEDVSSFMTFMMLLVFFLSFLVGTLLNNVVQLNQGIIFYSLKEENENVNTKNEIDLIGSGE